MALYPDDSLDARDLRWHAATRFQRHIGYGIETYDNTNTTAETVAADLDKTAAEVRNPAARYTAKALEKAGHIEAAERLYYILKELANDRDEVPVSQESLAHLAGFITTTTLPRGAIISIGPDGNATIEWHFTGPPEHGAKVGILAILIHQDATIQIAGVSAPFTETNRTRVSGRFSKTRAGNASRRTPPEDDPSGPLRWLAGPGNRHGKPVLTHLVGVGQLVGNQARPNKAMDGKSRPASASWTPRASRTRTPPGTRAMTQARRCRESSVTSRWTRQDCPMGYT